MVNSHGDDIYVEENQNNQYSGEPVTNDNDEELQQELKGNSSYDEAGDREIDINSSSWGGMQSGAVNDYESTQSSNWISTVPSKYRQQAITWASQKGMVKITPIKQKQKFTYTTIPYIAEHQEEPKAQIFPITDLQVIPHQITWDFYDTTEGRVGVSNAVEKHMVCEFDVYLTDLVASYWAFGDNDEYNYGIPSIPNLKKRWWNAVENNTYLNFEGDIESTKEFIDFRNNFLQQHSGWVCRFASHAFGVFYGVINDVSYNIGGGESFAKWHIKIEEAIFMEGMYSAEGKKPEAQTSDDGSTENSGAAADVESIDTQASE